MNRALTLLVVATLARVLSACAALLQNLRHSIVWLCVGPARRCRERTGGVTRRSSRRRRWRRLERQEGGRRVGADQRRRSDSRGDVIAHRSRSNAARVRQHGVCGRFDATLERHEARRRARSANRRRHVGNDAVAAESLVANLLRWAFAW